MTHGNVSGDEGSDEASDGEDTGDDRLPRSSDRADAADAGSESVWRREGWWNFGSARWITNSDPVGPLDKAIQDWMGRVTHSGSRA